MKYKLNGITFDTLTELAEYEVANHLHEYDFTCVLPNGEEVKATRDIQFLFMCEIMPVIDNVEPISIADAQDANRKLSRERDLLNSALKEPDIQAIINDAFAKAKTVILAASRR